MPREAYIIDAVRTPIGRGKPGGWLHEIHPVDLLAMTLDEVTRRAGCPKEAVEDVVAGCVTPAGDQASDVGRLATLRPGFPIEGPGLQINRFCCSAHPSIHL